MTGSDARDRAGGDHGHTPSRVVERSARHRTPAASSDFDQYARRYVAIIERDTVPITGESFEFFIALRLDLLAGELARVRAAPPAAILDFGCGIGVTERLLRDRYPQATIDGIDSSGESLEVAKRFEGRDVNFHLSSSVELPFADGSFDLIYSNGTFHHIDEVQHPAIFGELFRVLRPGGHLFVFENNPMNPLTLLVMRRNPMDRGAKVLLPWYLRRVQRRAGFDARAPVFYVFFPKQLKVLRPTEKHLRFLPFGAQYYVWGTKP
jgi:ubiquinone/menaquinone biosynthesis C-methylase UbiE